MQLSGLEPDAARALLDLQLGDAPAEEVTRRLIVETRGNPLALLELPGELTAAQLGGSESLPAQLHLTAHVEQTFLDRSRRLPQPQSVVLLAAADDTGELDVLRHASARLGVGRPTWRPPWTRLLVGDATSFSVRHPLVRSAVYQPPPGRTGAVPTGRWPMPWPARRYRP